MPRHIFTPEEEDNIKRGFYKEKIPITKISEKYHIGLKPLRRYIKEHNMVREDITLQSKNFIDETGNHYGRLEVIKNLHKKDVSNRNLFLCKCECGNLVEVNGKNLRNGNTRSCGCLQKETALNTLKEKTKYGFLIGNDLTGKKFGKLTAIKEVEKIIKKSGKPVRQWLCECECGNKIIVQHIYLMNGDTQSCGCIISQGENSIENILKENNINYIKQYSFNDLKDKILLRFDYGILDEYYKLKYLIEFDGEQHYDTKNAWYNLDTIKHDIIKNEYCLNNNIPLIRIPYKEKTNLKLELLQLETTNRNYIVKYKNHYNIGV